MTEAAPELKVSIEEPRSWARRLTITVPADRMERERRDVARDLARRVRLPGFRKGKVPPGMIERRYASVIEHETVERVVGVAYREALERHRFEPITQGQVENVDYRPGTDLTFRVEFEVRPEIQLDRLGGFQVQRQIAPVTDEAVDEVLQRLREQQSQWSSLDDGKPSTGDMVQVEITPLEDEAGEPRSYRIVLGDGQAVPDIEDAIRTLEPGGEGEFTIRVGGDAAEAGEERRVRIRLLEAMRPELPELDDEFARSTGEFEDLAALRATVREDLEREAMEDAERRVRHGLLEQVIEANPFDVPESMATQYLDRLLPARDDVDPAQLEEIRASARPAAARALKRMLVVERIAELHDLKATPAEVDARVEAIAERQGRSPGEVWAALQKGGRLAGLEDEITENKVFEFLVSQSTVT